MSPSPCSFTTALDKSFALTVSLPIISCLTLTSLLFSRVGNPFLTASSTFRDCLESMILDPDKPDWASDFNLFSKELASNFRTYDPVGKAEAELEGLPMHDSHQAMKYFIKFQQLASCVEWG